MTEQRDARCGASHEEAPRVEIAVAIVERQGQFLIGLRPDDVALAGYWEFPGGKVEPGEEAGAAAVRECREETGIDVTIAGEYPAADFDYPHGPLRLRFFACKVREQSGALPERFRWVERRQLRDYQFPPANRAIIELLSDRTV